MVVVVDAEITGGEVTGVDVCVGGDWVDLSFPGCWADIIFEYDKRSSIYNIVLD